VSQQHLSYEVKKSLLVAAVHGHPILAEVDKLDQDQVIHGWKPLPFAKYFDLLLCAVQQVDQDGYDNGQQSQLKHVVNGCDHIQDGGEALSFSPSAPDMILNISDVQDVIVKKSSQVKFGDSNTLYGFLQAQKFLQATMSMSCTIIFSNLITSDVFALALKASMTMDVMLSVPMVI